MSTPAESTANKLYVNLTFTDDTLQRLFANFGSITSARVAKGTSFGFVTFEKEEDAAQAMEALNGKLANLQVVPSVQVSVPKVRALRKEDDKNEKEKKLPLSKKPKQAKDVEEKKENSNLAVVKVAPEATKVILNPNPTEVAMKSEPVERQHGEHKFRVNGALGSQQVKQIASCTVKATLGKHVNPVVDFRKKFLPKIHIKEVTGKADETKEDVSLSIKVLDTQSGKSGEVYLRHVKGKEEMQVKQKSFRLSSMATDAAPAQPSSHFVVIEKMNVEASTGLWQSVELAVYSVDTPEKDIAGKVAEAEKKADDPSGATKGVRARNPRRRNRDAKRAGNVGKSSDSNLSAQ